ncbi:AAA family ATPase [Acinetobacter baumannii]|uniref:ATP-dependent nuclease n=1 Tax=Acinetobacter baumannii TaxID=470 RepID=UPI0013D3C9BF|nr:AAA family ATPase [Acinetobacter baumannii]MDA4940557.1 AAA family ATPase [Acinetobacter baumannii]MDC5575829.1 AAA family ATPase [Acinetobacter baumannii]
MKIDKVILKGFRNYQDATINFNNNTLIIGENDIGKTNLIYALRLMLDRSLSEMDIEPSELDFHVKDGVQSEVLEIIIRFVDIKEEAALSILKEHVSDDGVCIFKYTASKENLDYKLYLGQSESDLSEIQSRYYLKYINLKYISSQRDLSKFISKEKKQLLKISKTKITEEQEKLDRDNLIKIAKQLIELDDKVAQLEYVKTATQEVNLELKKLAYAHDDYDVKLNTSGIEVADFINKLQLGAVSGSSNVMLGGDGRNNQILIALWKALSVFEHDSNDEVVFYVIEEPEAHLHPHQQRKLASYLSSELPSQCLITTHSPQIASSFSPSSIIRLFKKDFSTIAASNGCTKELEKAWEELGYRMSIIPAEAFFSNGVLLVEGPSEEILYKEMLFKNEIDIDYYNLSIFSVGGIQFNVFAKVLQALEIPFAFRTDNDVSTTTIQSVKHWQYLGVNRCLGILDKDKWEHSNVEITRKDILTDPRWAEFEKTINSHGIYMSKVDLENDLVNLIESNVLEALKKESAQEAIDYLQGKKALRMQKLVAQLDQEGFEKIYESDLGVPIKYLLERLIHKSELESELASSDVAEEVNV